MDQGTLSGRREARHVFGRLFRLERERRGLTQAAIVERLDALAYPEGSTRARGPWAEKDPSWVSRIEAGAVAKLDRRIVSALCRALDCDKQERAALLLAAGFSPYPIPACDSWLELGQWYRCAAALLPEAGRITAALRPGPDDAGNGCDPHPAASAARHADYVVAEPRG
jgi:transcriptional regulator with XRE-family HTH domain